MNLIGIFCLLYLGATFVNGAPTNKNNFTLYDAIAEKCPWISSVADFKEQQPFLNVCTDWEKIKANQNSDNTTNVLCLLYFNSFIQFCTQPKHMNTINLTNINVNLSTVCDNLAIISNQTESDANLRKIISTPEICKKLCNDGFDSVVYICRVSYYYRHMLVVSPIANSINHFISVSHTDRQIQTATQKQQQQEQTATQKQQQQEQPPDEKPASTDKDQPQIPKSQITKQSSNAHQAETNKQELQSVLKNNNQELPSAAKNIEGIKSLHDDITEKKLHQHKSAADTVNDDQAPEPKPEPAPAEPIPESELEPSPTETKVDENNQVVEPQNTPNQNEDIVESEHNSIKSKNPQQIDENSNIDDGQNNEQSPPNAEPNIGQNESEEDIEEPLNPANEKYSKPGETAPVNYATEMDGDSYFFTYFMLLCVIFIVGYVCYHNKQKILALILEGRREKRPYRGRRPNSANYHKLDSNLGEAITSSCKKNSSNVIY